MQKVFHLKIQSLADFSFVVSHLEIHPAVHLNTSRADVSAVKKKYKVSFCLLITRKYIYEANFHLKN